MSTPNILAKSAWNGEVQDGGDGLSPIVLGLDGIACLPLQRRGYGVRMAHMCRCKIGNARHPHASPQESGRACNDGETSMQMVRLMIVGDD